MREREDAEIRTAWGIADATVAISDVPHVRALLIAAARHREPLTYTALLNALGHRFSRPRMRALCRTLDAIDEAGRACGEPELAALVVRQSDGLPGQGWWVGWITKGLGRGPRRWLTCGWRRAQGAAFTYWCER